MARFRRDTLAGGTMGVLLCGMVVSGRFLVAAACPLGRGLGRDTDPLAEEGDGVTDCRGVGN